MWGMLSPRPWMIAHMRRMCPWGQPATPARRCDQIGGRLLLPTGTVTFVLTDLDRLSWKRDAPEAVAAAITQLDMVLDEVIGEHGGARPTQPGSGDTVVAVFSRASDAVRAALDAQRALGAQAGPTVSYHGREWQCTPVRRSCVMRVATSAIAWRVAATWGQ